MRCNHDYYLAPHQLASLLQSLLCVHVCQCVCNVCTGAAGPSGRLRASGMNGMLLYAHTDKLSAFVSKWDGFTFRSPEPSVGGGCLQVLELGSDQLCCETAIVDFKYEFLIDIGQEKNNTKKSWCVRFFSNLSVPLCLKEANLHQLTKLSGLFSAVSPDLPLCSHTKAQKIICCSLLNKRKKYSFFFPFLLSSCRFFWHQVWVVKNEFTQKAHTLLADRTRAARKFKVPESAGLHHKAVEVANTTQQKINKVIWNPPYVFVPSVYGLFGGSFKFGTDSPAVNATFKQKEVVWTF